MGAAASVVPDEYQYLSDENKSEMKKEYEIMMSDKNGGDDQAVINALIQKHKRVLEKKPDEVYNESWMAYVTYIHSASLGIAEIIITDLHGSILAAHSLERSPVDIISLISMVSNEIKMISISLQDKKWFSLTNLYIDGILLLVNGTIGICIWKLNTICVIVQHNQSIKLECIVATTGKIVDYLKRNGC